MAEKVLVDNVFPDIANALRDKLDEYGDIVYGTEPIGTYASADANTFDNLDSSGFSNNTTYTKTFDFTNRGDIENIKIIVSYKTFTTNSSYPCYFELKNTTTNTIIFRYNSTSTSTGYSGNKEERIVPNNGVYTLTFRMGMYFSNLGYYMECFGLDENNSLVGELFPKDIDLKQVPFTFTPSSMAGAIQQIGGLNADTSFYSLDRSVRFDKLHFMIVTNTSGSYSYNYINVGDAITDLRQVVLILTSGSREYSYTGGLFVPIGATANNCDGVWNDGGGRGYSYLTLQLPEWAGLGKYLHLNGADLSYSNSLNSSSNYYVTRLNLNTTDKKIYGYYTRGQSASTNNTNLLNTFGASIIIYGTRRDGIYG